MKTAISGFSSHYPDYAMLVIDAEKGLTPITIEHMKMAYGFQVPVIIVITKIDLVSKHQLRELFDEVKLSLKDKLLVTMKEDQEDIMLYLRNLKEVTPLFFISNKNKKGLNVLQQFLYQLPLNDSKRWHESSQQNPEFRINDFFKVDIDKTGTQAQVLSGILISGQIHKR